MKLAPGCWWIQRWEPFGSWVSSPRLPRHPFSTTSSRWACHTHWRDHGVFPWALCLQHKKIGASQTNRHTRDFCSAPLASTCEVLFAIQLAFFKTPPNSVFVAAWHVQVCKKKDSQRLIFKMRCKFFVCGCFAADQKIFQKIFRPPNGVFCFF